MIAIGGLLTFDDYSKVRGVAQAIHEFLATHAEQFSTPVQDNDFLVVRRIG